MENSHRFFENRDCKYYPCHKNTEHINCLFCYCPMYTMPDCPGHPRFVKKREGYRKVCTDCDYPHRAENYDEIVRMLKTRGFFEENEVISGND